MIPLQGMAVVQVFNVKNVSIREKAFRILIFITLFFALSPFLLLFYEVKFSIAKCLIFLAFAWDCLCFLKFTFNDFYLFFDCSYLDLKVIGPLHHRLQWEFVNYSKLEHIKKNPD